MLATGQEAYEAELNKHMSNIATAAVVFAVIIAIVGGLGMIAGPAAPVLFAFAALLTAYAAYMGVAYLFLSYIVGHLPDRIISTKGVEMYGGTQGTPFTDASKTPADIARIRVWADDVVHGIQVAWHTGAEPQWSVLHGEEVGLCYELPGSGENFPISEKIVLLEGRSGYVVDQLTFCTSANRRMGPIGGKGGSSFILKPEGDMPYFIGFQGRCGRNLDAIGGISSLYGSSQLGGRGGTAFLDKVPVGGRLSKVDIRCGGYIDSIQATYIVDGAPQLGPQFGGNGGELRTLNIGADEYIESIKARVGEFIDGLQFTLRDTKTNATRVWPGVGQFVGGTGGHEDEISAAPGMRVVGFWGRCGLYVDALGISVAKA